MRPINDMVSHNQAMRSTAFVPFNPSTTAECGLRHIASARRSDTGRSCQIQMSAQPFPSKFDRRRLINVGIIISSVVATTFGRPGPSNAASTKVWGAAELDLRMYMCEAFGKGCLERAEVVIAPARTLDVRLAKALSAIPGAALRAVVPSVDPSQEESKLRASLLAQFQKRVAFPADNIANQYTFDYETYVGWRLATSYMPEIAQRKAFSALVGKEILRVMKDLGLIDLEVYDARKQGLTKAIQNCKLLAGGVIGETVLVADDYDEKFWSSSGPVTTLSLTSTLPAFMQACMQLSAEGSGLSPNYIALAITAYLQSCMVDVDYNDYFVDNVYRPNPDDFQPTQIVVQFSVRPQP